MKSTKCIHLNYGDFTRYIRDTYKIDTHPYHLSFCHLRDSFGNDRSIKFYVQILDNVVPDGVIDYLASQNIPQEVIDFLASDDPSSLIPTITEKTWVDFYSFVLNNKDVIVNTFCEYTFDYLVQSSLDLVMIKKNKISEKDYHSAKVFLEIMW